MRFDPRVCRECQRLEILSAQGLLDFYHDHAGFGQKPMVFLKDNDVVRCTITGLGTLENKFIR